MNLFRRSPSKARDKADMLAARPVRLEGIDVVPAGDGAWRLTVPFRPTRFAAAVLRVPATATRTFELDDVGKFVYDGCDGKTSVAQLIRRLARQYHLNEREAEVSTLAFLNTLAGRRLIAIVVTGTAQERRPRP